jgi:hypothetical protein
MMFGNDSLHRLEDPKDKTKTQEETGNQGPNRKESEKGQCVTETQQPIYSKADDDRNWKVVGRKSSTPLWKVAMRGGDGGSYKDGEKADDTASEGNNSTHKFGGLPGSSTRGGDGGSYNAGKYNDKNNNTYKFGGPPGAPDGGVRSLLRGGDQHGVGGVRSSANSRTIEVRFVIDVNHHRDFNLCMRLREFIVEARVMDPTFSVLALGGNGGASTNRKNVQTQRRE